MLPTRPVVAAAAESSLGTRQRASCSMSELGTTAKQRLRRRFFPASGRHEREARPSRQGRQPQPSRRQERETPHDRPAPAPAGPVVTLAMSGSATADRASRQARSLPQPSRIAAVPRTTLRPDCRRASHRLCYATGRKGHAVSRRLPSKTLQRYVETYEAGPRIQAMLGGQRLLLAPSLSARRRRRRRSRQSDLDLRPPFLQQREPAMRITFVEGLGDDVGGAAEKRSTWGLAQRTEGRHSLRPVAARRARRDGTIPGAASYLFAAGPPAWWPSVVGAQPT